MICICVAAGACFSAACAAQAVTQDRTSAVVPLAYVRSLVVVPVALVTPVDPPLPPPPLPSKQKDHDRWHKRVLAREATADLRRFAVDSFEASLKNRLGQSRGALVEWDATAVPADIAIAFRGMARRRLEVNPQQGSRALRPAEYAVGIMAAHQVDACIVTLVDRFGSNVGLEREVWLRAIAWLWRRDSKGGSEGLRGPYFAVGRAVSGRKLIGKGFGRTDEQLAQVAATLAASRLVGTLETGRRPLFMEDCLVAVIPAFVPTEVEKSISPLEESASLSGTALVETVSLPLSSLNRERDVLFQPESSPVARSLVSADVEQVLWGAGVQLADIWQGGNSANEDLLGRISARLDADYLFASRIRDVALADTPDIAPDLGQLRPAIKRQADVEVEGLLYGVREHAVLWRDRAEGGTIAVTEYVRHKPRLRSDEQCVADAARTAYSHLRSGFEDYRRKFDRDTITAGRAKQPGAL